MPERDGKDHGENITHYVARLVFGEKGNMGIGIISTWMNIGGYIILVPYLEPFGTNSLHMSLFFVFVTLPEGAASKPSSATTEAPNSRLRPVIAQISYYASTVDWRGLREMSSKSEEDQTFVFSSWDHQ